MDILWRCTLTGKFSYDWQFAGMSLEVFMNSLKEVEPGKYKNKELKERTYTFDIYTTIIQTVVSMYTQNKEDMKLYLRGQLDGDKYASALHRELTELYLCYKNTPDFVKTERGFYLKNITSSSRDDTYTTYIENIDEYMREVYDHYIDITLKKITEHLLITQIDTMNISNC